jgi:3-deoxy-manno-octulosonate cytidylyltransferase (CMP-KDO synthetase)
MKTAIIIPARYGSQRLPGKPLLRATGKYLIQHVYERASLAKRVFQVVVATDDQRIAAAVASFGGEAVMTEPTHASGTDRVAEVAKQVPADVVINLQGDEPLVDPSSLDFLAELMERDPNADMATLAAPLTSREQWLNPSCVKVVRDRRGRALYFSRSPIPHVRDGEPDFAARPPVVLQHLGVYAYRRPALFRLALEPVDAVERLEKLEQLRALALGYRIQVGIVEHAARGIDTPEDYAWFVRTYKQLETQSVAA